MSQEVEEIKSKIDIADFMSGYLKLTPAGANFKALCPFHNEKTPSMMINPAKQIWRCFGCNEGGDVFSFLMKLEGMEFPEAKKFLAQRAGVKLATYDSKGEGKRSKLHDVSNLAERYWHKILLESDSAKDAKKYVEDRGISQETIEDFHLGYSIDNWDNLTNFLKKKEYDDQTIFLAGLSIKRNNAVGYYDRFRGRLMFPILDINGKTVGFGARTLKKDDDVKYINTPQTQIYNKSMVLYGLYQAKEAIRQKDLCILVEGYMDVIPSHQAGVKNVVAISGTALTEHQLKILKRYTNNLALALDMDEAGRRAAERSIDLALAEEMDVKIVTLPDGIKDPGECVSKDPKIWQQAIDDAKPVIEYFFNQEVDNKDMTDGVIRKKSIRFVLAKIVKLKSRIDQEFWLKKLSQRLDISEDILRLEIKELVHLEPTAPNVQAVVVDKQIDVEWEMFKKLLAVLLAKPSKMGEIIDRVAPEYINDQGILSIYKNIILFYTKGNTALSDESDLFDLLNDWFKNNQLEDSQRPADLLAESFLLFQKDYLELDDSEIQMAIDGISRVFKERYLKNKINELKHKLELVESGRADGDVEEIYAQLGELIKQKNF
jgi:DNA primase